jgi:hypothetical protein
MILSAPELADFPVSPSNGDIVFNTSLDAAYVWAPGAPGVVNGGWLFLTSGSILRSSERVTDTLTRSAYAGRDYQTFLDEVSANIKSNFGSVYNDFLTAAPGRMLMRFISAALDTLSFNMDQRSVEAYMFLATLRSSIARNAHQQGYKPNRATAASLDLTLTLPDGPYAFDVSIKAGFQFDGPNGLVFEQSSDTVIPSGSTVASNVGYHQGETVIEVFTSNGTANQRFKLRRVGADREIARDTVTCLVNGTTWNENDFLPFAPVNEFEVSYDTSPPFVRFGDSVLGNIPAAGVEIRIKYVATKGELGNSVPVNTVTQPKTALVANFQDITVVGSHTGSSSGGAPAEDSRSVQANSPRFFSTANRAVSQPDWDALLNVFSDGFVGTVAKGRAQVIRGVKKELTIQSLLAAIKAASSPTAGLATITAANVTIRSKTNAVRAKVVDIGAQHDAVAAKKALLDTSLAGSLTDTSNAKTVVATLKAELGDLPYQELLGVSDGSTTVFASGLSKLPVVPGTVAVLVSPMNTVASDSNGDANSFPGQISIGASVFTSDMVGQIIKIGADYRRIIAFASGTLVTYSGPKISGTTLHVYVYGKTIQAFDDGAGAIVGAGITTGTINYATGSVSITFAAAPSGDPGFGGHPVMCSYRYKDAHMRGETDSINTYIVDAETKIATAQADSTAMAALLALIDADEAAINGLCTNIDTSTATSDGGVGTAQLVQEAVGIAADNLESYLDTVISGECKANIVQCKILTLDANDDYAPPTQALCTAVKAYFDPLKIITTTCSVVSGYRDLIAVNITIKIEVERNFLYAKVRPLVDAVVTPLLKKRDYNVPLLVSTLYRTIVPFNGVGGVTGVASAIVKITDTTWKDPSNTDPVVMPNADGDLIPPDGTAIVRGTITYSELVRASS